MAAKKVVAVIVAVAVLAGGVAIVGSSMSSGVFNLTLAEVVSQPERFVGRDFKVVGTVIEGSISRGGGPFELDFAIGDGLETTLKCHHKGAVPDPFADGREVILQGTLAAPGRMEVSKITVKCPSKYQEENISEERYDDYYNRKYKDGHRKQ